MNANFSTSRTIYLNALPIMLESSIPVIEMAMNKEFYTKLVKQWLMNAEGISYWTPRPRPSDVIYTTYVTAINSTLDYAKQRLVELKNVIKIVGEESLEIGIGSRKIVEHAIMKRFIAQGWICSVEHTSVCYFQEPFESKYLFRFYRSIKFRVEYLKDGDKLLLILLPRLHAEGPTLEEIFESFGEEALRKLVNSECIAWHNIEGKYHRAILLEIMKIGTDKYRSKVVFYDGTSADLELDKVKLVGNVLYYKNFVTDLYGEKAYEELEKRQRSYSFSLGPKESSFTTASKLKDAVLEIVRSSRVFPFTLGGVKVDVDMNLFEIGSGANI